jgi:hypothetical protein
VPTEVLHVSAGSTGLARRRLCECLHALVRLTLNSTHVSCVEFCCRNIVTGDIRETSGEAFVMGFHPRTAEARKCMGCAVHVDHSPRPRTSTLNRFLCLLCS